MEFALGDLIWVFPHDDLSWCPGEIVKIEEDAYIAIAKNSADDSLYRIEKKNAFPVHPSCMEKVPDLLSLGEFNEGALLHNIRCRYLDNQIYTSVGIPILISLNPYSKLPIYTEKIAQSYRTQSGKNIAPHLFLMADKAYAALKDGNQSIIISGESGAGKTEAAKIILSYLAAGDSQNNLSKQVLDTNPILEAFGNAKTLRNDNSSRFGKFIEIHFDSVTLKLLSARILNYLLEKSRIVSQQIGERNYHFFYQICAGASEEEREKYKILPASEFAYLNKGECLEIDGVDDMKNYEETRECMRVLGFTDEEQESIMRIVMGILHLGNVEFEGDDSAIVVNSQSMEIACGLLGCSYEVLEKVLTTRVIVDPTNNKEIVMKQKASQATYTKDATAKGIYSKLFTWLVERINKTIYIQQKKPSKIIGLLDIYGFEVFDVNSFEQFCINYANEKLQQHFNHHMFKLEQHEYSKEKIKWDHINYEDNQVCIDLIEKTPIGLITLLDEQSKLPKGTDKQFLSNVYGKLSGNPKLCNPGQYANEYFGVGHYAGDVYYNVEGFLEKNKDALNPQLIRAIEKSSLGLLVSIFAVTGKKQATPGSLSALTLATQFKSQLQDLIKALSGSTPSYIRCIKPNSEKAPKLFDSHDVQRQLRCAGMLECIRIRKAGYSVRRNVKEFMDKYWIIAPESRKSDASTVNQCKVLLGILGKMKHLKKLMDPEKKLIQVGISMVFMKDELRQALDIEYSKSAFKFAVLIQKHVRAFRLRKQFLKRKKAVVAIQKCVKYWLFKKRLERKVKKIKASLASISCKKIVQRKKNAVLKIRVFLQQAASKVYISYFKPVSTQKKVKSSLENEDFPVPEEVTNYSVTSFEENLFQTRHEPRKLKELTSGQSPVIETLQVEIKNLSYLLTREKEKCKSFQDEAVYYKEIYQNALVQIQSMQSDCQSVLINPENADSDRLKSENSALQREVKAKTNEIELLQMKVRSLDHSVEEIEDGNKELRQKESALRRKFELEMLKHNKEIEEYKRQMQQFSSERAKIDASGFEKEIRTLKIQVRTLENENSLLSNALSEQNFKLNDFQQTEKDLKDQIKALQEETHGLNDHYSKIESQNTKKLLGKVTDQQRTIEILKKETESLTESLENLNNENSKLEYYKEESAKFIRQNNEKKVVIKELESQIEQLHNDKLELTRFKIGMNSLNPSANMEKDHELVRNLKEQIDELTQEIEDLEKELSLSKQVYGTLLTLLKVKNSELELYKGNSEQKIEELKEEEDALIAQ